MPVLPTLGLLGSSPRTGKPESLMLPSYSLLPTTNPSSDESTSSAAGRSRRSHSAHGNIQNRTRRQQERSEDSETCRRYDAHPKPSAWDAMPVLPSRARFLADFTLGFADGLTVPFALTAGLSSLGRTDTVVYAGVAEICAGSISMGIGGYLSAKGDAAANAERTSEEGDEEEDDDMEVENGLVAHADADADETEKIHGPDGLPVEVLDYVRVLELPPRLLQLVAEHVREKPHVSDAVAAIAKPEGDGDARPCSPVMVGLSVSLGYVLGGLLPLFPYFFVDRVADGVYWSFAVCLAALFAFGFIKDYVLNCQRREKETKQLCYERRRCRRWADIRRSSWEGFQMVILGGVAALAAVLCVGFFEGFREAPSDVS